MYCWFQQLLVFKSHHCVTPLLNCLKYHTMLQRNFNTYLIFHYVSVGGQNTFAYGCTAWSHTRSRAAYFLWSLCQQHRHGEYLTSQVQFTFKVFWMSAAIFFLEVFDSNSWICHHTSHVPQSIFNKYMLNTHVHMFLLIVNWHWGVLSWPDTS